ncbi:MAG: YabP/YqfC family sporulation protein [Candidatus Gallimonas sp.]
MRLFSEILRQLGAEGEWDAFRVQYTVVDGRGGYFQNVKKIGEFSPQRIVFLGKKSRVVVEGEGLSIGKYYAGDASVIGKIVRVEREEC